MLSQDVLPPSDASAKYQARSGILTPPIADNYLNDGSGLGSKKRKREENTMEDLLKDCFVVRVSSKKFPLAELS